MRNSEIQNSVNDVGDKNGEGGHLLKIFREWD